MVFDRTKRVVERHSQNRIAANLLERAKLFYGLEKAAWDRHDPDFQRLVYEGFFLPFPHTGLVLDNWCAFFEDPEEKSKGPDVARNFIVSQLDSAGDLLIASGVLARFSVSREEDLRLDLKTGIGEVIVTRGEQCEVVTTDSPLFRSIVPKDLVADLLTQAIAAVAITNLPTHFIVEESELPSAPRPPKGTPVLPSQKRPRYTVLTPGEIRTRLKKDPRFEKDLNGDTKKVEFRRAHERLLSHERWTKSRGKTIHVRAVWNDAITWDEPAEHKRYRILLDR